MFTLGGHLTVQSLRMGGQIVLTRLLPPEVFGLMAIVHAFRAAFDLFSDIGISPSIIQNERGEDPKFLNTAWTIQAVRGTCLFVFASLCALPVSKFYGHPQLAVLIPVASVSALIAGLQTTKVPLAERRLELARTTLIEVLAQVAALVVMVTWALHAPSVWALVAGALTGASTDVILSHLLLRGHNGRFGWDKASAQALLRFGRWIFISTILTYAVGQADRLIFGKITSLAHLGIYHVALTIISVPTTAMHQLAGKVIFPLFSRVQQTGERLSEVFNQARRLHLVLSGWTLSGLIGGGQAAIGLIYEDTYAAGGWMLQIMGFGAWIATPDATNGYMLLSRGQPRWLAAANFSKLVGMIVCMPLAYHFGGFPAALVAFAGTEFFRYATSTVGVYRHGLRTLRQDAGFALVLLAASVAGKLTVDFLVKRGVAVGLQALGVFVVATLIWSPWLWPYARGFVGRWRRDQNSLDSAGPP